jgi:hypothetical protein
LLVKIALAFPLVKEPLLRGLSHAVDIRRREPRRATMKRLLGHVRNAVLPTIEASAGCAPQDRRDTKCDAYGHHYHRTWSLSGNCAWYCGAWINDGDC